MLPHVEILGIHINLYGAMMLLGLICAFFALWRGMRSRGMRVECAVVVASCALGFGLIGGYLLFLIASVGIPALAAAAREGALWDVLSRGGLVFYGGLIGGTFGVWVGARIAALRFFAVADLCVPALALAHAFGRVGCLFAGCCHGMPGDLFFCFPLSPYIAGGAPLYPVQLFEAACNFALFLLLARYLKKPRPPARTSGLYLMAYAVCRLLLEFLRDDPIRGHIGPLSTSQFVSIPILLIGALLFFGAPRFRIDPDPFLSDIGKLPGFGPDRPGT